MMLTSQKRNHTEGQLDELEYNSHKLSKWEASFVESLRHQLDQSGSISPRQEEILNDLYKRTGA